jgi:26S proteasome regulatory subunit T1
MLYGVSYFLPTSYISQEEQPLQVARCTKIIGANTDETKYVINLRQIAKFVVGLGEKVSPTDIDEGMRVGESTRATRP